jgi:lipopolysaccharide export system permease protein
MPRLLYTYLASQILAPFYASLLILTSVLFLSRLIPILDIILGYGIGIADFLRLFTYFTPKLLLFALPMASMMGVIIGTTRLTNDNETMVLKSSGISLYRMLPPVIIIALCTSLITGYFSIHLIPVGNQAKAQLLFQLAKEKIDRSLHEKKFSESLGDMVLYTDKKNPQTQQWEGIYVTDMRDKQNPVTVIARTGTISTDINKGSLVLQLNDGSLHRNRKDTNQTIDFKQYVLDVPVAAPKKNPLAKAGRPNMTQGQLRQEAVKLGRDTKDGVALLIEFHKRLALPVSCFILTILGFPLGLLAGPRQRAIGIPLGLLIFILYYALLTAGQSFSEALVLPVGPAMWMPNVVFFLFTLFFIRSVAVETHTASLEKLFDAGHIIAQKLPWRSRRTK